MYFIAEGAQPLLRNRHKQRADLADANESYHGSTSHLSRPNGTAW
jgi:hypothetical protein